MSKILYTVIFLLTCKFSYSDDIKHYINVGDVVLGEIYEIIWSNDIKKSDIINIEYDCELRGINITDGLWVLELKPGLEIGEIERSVIVNTSLGDKKLVVGYKNNVNIKNWGEYDLEGLELPGDGTIKIFEAPAWLSLEGRGVEFNGDDVGLVRGVIRWVDNGINELIYTYNDKKLIPTSIKRGYTRKHKILTQELLYRGVIDNIKVEGSILYDYQVMNNRIVIYLLPNMEGILKSNIILHINNKRYDLPIEITVVE